MPTDLKRRWNHNTHYHRLVLAALPANARSALDVGTGDGLLATDLRERVPEVVAIDPDAAVLERARASEADVQWLHGDVMTQSLPLAHFDLVGTIATVHHLPDLADGLSRFAELTAPGGSVVVVGCARASTVSDYLVEGVGILQHQVLSRTRGYWQHSAPVEMRFPHTYSEVRSIATATLPGVRWRRLPLFRYLLHWTRPAELGRGAYAVSRRFG
ncbi:Methyltransferase type 11 [Kribbella flavida DSM 17836]|uniref:Methyltransferase type 11 n=1 Tax=Kribbella flavida (strain DSM 17836 / JCM 10339 / NBRC 14399) TaxID=479435 RepID=D2PZM0_KRIFD|nr:class I SAM-dependent methyltransferase [Kribbella flavida]ADB35586.1 Methyltransferase type 11 [Kribbella flavida DSM 17836]